MSNRDSPNHFYCKAAGVSHANEDGTSRQSVIGRCNLGEPIALDHDESNAFDKYAVRLLRSNGDQIGFLPSDLARQVVQRSNTGTRYAAFISDLTGGTSDRPTRGVNLLMVAAPPGVSDAEAQDYIDRTLGSDPTSNLAGLGSSSGSGCASLVCMAIIVATSVLFFIR